MKKGLLTAAAFVALSTTAFAADLPARRAPPVFAPPPPVPVFTWTGFYIGVQAGYQFGNDHTTYTSPFATGEVFAANAKSNAAFFDGVGILGGTTTDTYTHPHGVTGGGHVGYLFSTQSIPGIGGLLGGGGVFGIEGDVNASDYHSSSFSNNGVFVGDGEAFGSPYGSIRSRIQGSIRGRLGVAFDRILVYATGGAAFANFNVGTTDYFGNSSSYSHSRVGYTVGGGVEYAFTNNVSVRAEYRYSDYGTFTGNSATGTVFYDTGLVSRHRETSNLVQGGISYRFDTPVTPVVARY